MEEKKLLDLYFIEYKATFLKAAEEYHSSIRMGDRDSSVDGFNTIYTGLSLYCEINNTQIEKSITDGNKDYSIDAIYIPEDSSSNICIFDFKKNSELNYQKIKEFTEYIEKYILDGNDLPREGNDQLKARLMALHDILSKNSERKINIVIYREGEIDEQRLMAEKNKLEILKLKYDRVGIIELISKKQIYELLMRKLWYEGNIYAKSSDNFLLKFSASESILSEKNLIISNVKLFDMMCFIQNIEDLNSKTTQNRRYDIFKLNVRKKTDSSTEIRNNIIETINSTPEKFINYHNGITITCENFLISDNQISFIQPQIVNGCQTISGIYDAFKNDVKEYLNILGGEPCLSKSKDEVIKIIGNIENLKKSKITIKIIITESVSSEPKKISKYANSQTTVKPKELVVNNLDQLIISNYLRVNGFNYHRKEGQVVDNTMKTISLEQLYKFMYGYIYLDPSKGKNDLNTVLFKDDELYTKFFPDIFSLQDIIKISEQFIKISEYRRKNRDTSRYYNDFISFGLFLVYKEGSSLTDVKVSTIKGILDQFIEDKKLIHTNELRFYFQVNTKEITSFLIGKLEEKYHFTVDREKFRNSRNEFVVFEKKVISESNSMKNDITYKPYNLEKLNEYMHEKKLSGKKVKNFIYVVLDIVDTNNGINAGDLEKILKIFYKEIGTMKDEYMTEIIDCVNRHPDKLVFDNDFIYQKK